MKYQIGDLVRSKKSSPYNGKLSSSIIDPIPKKTIGIVVDLLESTSDGELWKAGEHPDAAKRIGAVKIHWGAYGSYWDTLDRLEKLNG